MSTYEPTTFEPTPDGPTPPRRRAWPWIAWPVSVVGGFVAGLGIGITFQPDEASAASDGIATLQAAKQVCADESPFVVIGDDGTSLTIDGVGEEQAGASWSELACVLVEIGVPDSVNARMDNTRALDGMQDAAWGAFHASWNYHPDSGVNMVIEVRETP